MPDEPQVLVPLAPTLVFSAMAVIAMVLFIVALVTLWRARTRIPTSHLMGWTAGIVLAPLLGSLLWLTFGRRVGLNAGADEARVSMR